MTDHDAPKQGRLGAPVCTKPDGGCQREVMFVPSATSGKPMILDPVPVKGVVLVMKRGATVLAAGPHRDASAAVVDVYRDHHGTCPAWLAKEERERKTRIMTGLGKDRPGRSQGPAR